MTMAGGGDATATFSPTHTRSRTKTFDSTVGFLHPSPSQASKTSRRFFEHPRHRALGAMPERVHSMPLERHRRHFSHSGLIVRVGEFPAGCRSTSPPTTPSLTLTRDALTSSPEVSVSTSHSRSIARSRCHRRSVTARGGYLSQFLDRSRTTTPLARVDSMSLALEDSFASSPKTTTSKTAGPARLSDSDSSNAPMSHEKLNRRVISVFALSSNALATRDLGPSVIEHDITTSSALLNSKSVVFAQSPPMHRRRRSMSLPCASFGGAHVDRNVIPDPASPIDLVPPHSPSTTYRQMRATDHFLQPKGSHM